jgi:hypothetical protein
MAAKSTNAGTEADGGQREHRGFRLDGRTIAIVEDLALGIESGESGLKSCTLGAVSTGNQGANGNQVAMVHNREVPVIEDEDEYLNAIGDMLAQDFSHEEIAQTVKLSTDGVHVLALERWCDQVRLSYRTRVPPAHWEGSSLHERRGQGRRAMAALRTTREGIAHAAVLHIVYGHPEPLMLWTTRFIHEQETAPAGSPVTVEAGDRDAFAVGKVLLALGPEFGPLAKYTDAVEAKRQEMVRAAVASGSKQYVPAHERPHPQHGHENQIIGLSAAIAHANEASEVFRLAAVHGLKHNGSITTVDGYQLFDLERARSLRHWHDRNLTSGDALRHALAPFTEPMPVHGEGENHAQWEARKEERRVRRLAHEARAEAFLTDVRRDANRMLTDASHAFQAAWLAS